MGNDEGCKVQYRLMDNPTWFTLDDSGIGDDVAQKGVRYGEGDEA